MKQSGRIWNQTLNAQMVSWGFIHLSCEWCVYVRQDADGMTAVAVHVDDMILAHSDDREGNRFQSGLESVWRISALGIPRFALGIAIFHDPPNRLVRISQTALIDRIISQFGLAEVDSVSTPIPPGPPLYALPHHPGPPCHPEPPPGRPNSQPSTGIYYYFPGESL